MEDHPTPPRHTTPPNDLAGLLHDFGADWQIEIEPGGMYVAIERKPPPVLRFQLAVSAEGLRVLLEADRVMRGADAAD